MALKDKLMTLEDFKAVRDVDVASNSAQFTEIKADLANVNELKYDLLSDANWEIGQVDTTTGGESWSNAKLRTGYIEIPNNALAITCSVDSGWKYMGFVINDAKTLVTSIINWSTRKNTIDLTALTSGDKGYFRFVLQRTDNTIDVADYTHAHTNYDTTLVQTLSGLDSDITVLENKANSLDNAIKAENRLENRLAFDASGSFNPNANISINVYHGIISVTDNNFGSSVHLELKNPVSTISSPSAATKFLTLLANHVYRLRTIPVSGNFTGLDNNVYCAISSGGASADYIVNASGGELTFSYDTDTAVSIYAYVKYETTATVVFQYALEDISANDNGDYIIGSDLRKRTVNVSPRLGILSGAQAFCMYDEKYYSFNNTDSKIYVQNSNFEAVSNHSVSIGHGNALQLGSGKYAYASGFDDNKVYKVDLDSVTVVDTINLPTTYGTTTCAVDDVNGIVYIFHRTTSPYTEEPYTFIAYDYINETELYRRKTPPFAAMQGCDLVNGTIITVSGLGTSGYPDLTNYYRLFNTSGDVIGEYKIPSFASREPEGVFIDRTTFDVYFDIQKSIYKVSSLDT